MRENKGYAIEEFMRKWFKGKMHGSDCVDFQTKTTLYEVKSCNLFNRWENSNNLRNYKTEPHKRIRTTHLGRFFIKVENHELLKTQAECENKIAKYIFVINISGQRIFRTKTWDEVNELIYGDKTCPIRIKDIFSNLE